MEDEEKRNYSYTINYNIIIKSNRLIIKHMDNSRKVITRFISVCNYIFLIIYIFKLCFRDRYYMLNDYKYRKIFIICQIIFVLINIIIFMYDLFANKYKIVNYSKLISVVFILSLNFLIVKLLSNFRSDAVNLISKIEIEKEKMAVWVTYSLLRSKYLWYVLILSISEVLNLINKR